MRVESFRERMALLKRGFAAQFNERSREAGSPVRVDLNTGRTTRDYSDIETTEILRVYVAGPFQTPENRDNVYRELVRRLTETNSKVSEDIALSLRAEWIKRGAGPFSTEKSRRESRTVIGLIDKIPTMPSQIDASQDPLQSFLNRPDVSQINTLDLHWNAVLQNPMAAPSRKANAESAIQFLAAHMPTPPTFSS